jgi:hypothetical protein
MNEIIEISIAIEHGDKLVIIPNVNIPRSVMFSIFMVV